MREKPETHKIYTIQRVFFCKFRRNSLLRETHTHTKRKRWGEVNELKNWNEVTKGLYRYVIGANVCYEIHLLYHAKETDILTAKSSLYIVGDWTDKDRNSFFERECLLAEQPLFECLEKAYEDDKQNNN